MTDRQVYGVCNSIDAIAFEKNKDLLGYVMKDMTRKLVDVAAEQAFDGEKIISIKDDPVEIDKYTNALIYKKRMYIEDMIICRDCKAYLPETETLASYCPVLKIYRLPEDAYCYKAQRKKNDQS